jgi:hypothetical protein
MSNLKDKIKLDTVVHRYNPNYSGDQPGQHSKTPSQKKKEGRGLGTWLKW